MRLNPISLWIPNPNLNASLIRRALEDLEQIRKKNDIIVDSPSIEDRKERMRRRLREAKDPRKELEDILSIELRAQSLVLSLYIESNGQEWLPPFDDEMAVQVLGREDTKWSSTLRRRMVALFFERFESLPALPFLCEQLAKAFVGISRASGEKELIWASAKDELFHPHGHRKIIQNHLRKGESLQQIMERFAIPRTGNFAAILRFVHLLETLKRCDLGAEPDVLHEIEKDREILAKTGYPLGAEALRIMVTRVATEGGSDWPNEWGKWLVRLGCDPRIGVHTAEGAKWWGWATSSQLNLAIKAMIELTLKTFFDFLDGTVSVQQWKERRQFLDALFDAGKIDDARLVFNSIYMQKLSAEMRNEMFTAKLSSAQKDKCFIALRCKDDVFILEGISSFAIRAFYRTFPVKGFWERDKNQFTDNELRISPAECPIFVEHRGDWVGKFLNLLASEFHVEWDIRRP